MGFQNLIMIQLVKLLPSIATTFPVSILLPTLTFAIPFCAFDADEFKCNNDPVVNPFPLWDTSMAFPDVNSSASIDSILPLCTLFGLYVQYHFLVILF